MFTNENTEMRKRNLAKMAELGYKGYQHNRLFIERDSLTEEIIKKYSYLNNEEKSEDFLTISGRVMLNRSFGNLVFLTIQDSTNKLQIVISKSDLDINEFKVAQKALDLGDIIKVSGYPMRTQKGELSLKAKNFIILTKALSPLPEKFHGLTDQETKYRKRYLDMIMNPDVKTTMINRSKIISTIRSELENYGFIEVETPILNNIPGGANAKPFITHHNALGEDRYLRIAPELYLKRCIIGGIDKVFEIGKNFRNEGIDATHNPEFTSVEFYWAYNDYVGLMSYIEYLILFIANKVAPEKMTNLTFGDKVVDLTNFNKISFKNSLIKIGGIKEDILFNIEAIKSYLKEVNIKFNESDSLGKLWSILFDEFVEDKLINPTFITDYPTDISPLARKKDGDEMFTERFELFIAGKEIANGFNELNDPEDQYQRFLEQVKSKDSDDEAMHMDKDFIEALMIGMPPVAGAGIGIDRLVMLLTEQTNIKDVIIFPAMKTN